MLVLKIIVVAWLLYCLACAVKKLEKSDKEIPSDRENHDKEWENFSKSNEVHKWMQ